MPSVKKIQTLLRNIDRNQSNKTDKIYINAVKNEFIKLNGNFKIPRIQVKELDYTLAFSIIEDIQDFIPEFLFEHTLLEKRKPASEEHSLHFVKPVKGRIIDFIHIFKIDFKFGGDPINIIEKGDTYNYPSYNTGRLYYKSRLIPVPAQNDRDQIIDFNPVKVIETNYIESDKLFFTSTIFDEVNKNAITEEIQKRVNLNIFNISQKLYPFIVYDYFTACFNVLYPALNEIVAAAELFEPVFLMIFSKYNKLNELFIPEELAKIFSGSLIVDNNNLTINDLHIQRLREYFTKYSIYRDDQLMLNGWWRIDISGDLKNPIYQ